MPRRNTNKRRRRRPATQNSSNPILTIPRVRLTDTCRTIFTYQATIASNGSGVIASSSVIGSTVFSLADFSNFALVFDRFAVIASNITLIPYLNSSGNTTTALAVAFVNDGVVGTPANYQTVLEISGSKLYNPRLSESYGKKLIAKCKATLDPWLPTVSPTATQQLQYGGYVFYGAGNTSSITVWTVLIRYTVIFTMKV